MTAALPSAGPHPARSPFAGADICRQAGFTLPPGTRGPRFDDDAWDFSDVTGLPVSMQPAAARFNFTPVINPGWRLAAKELMFAMLVPRNETVALLAHAYRTPLHIATAKGRLDEVTRLLNWLTSQGVASLMALARNPQWYSSNFPTWLTVRLRCS